jgi:hypothetical protein
VNGSVFSWAVLRRCLGWQWSHVSVSAITRHGLSPMHTSAFGPSLLFLVDAQLNEGIRMMMLTLSEGRSLLVSWILANFLSYSPRHVLVSSLFYDGWHPHTAII